MVVGSWPIGDQGQETEAPPPYNFVLTMPQEIAGEVKLFTLVRDVTRSYRGVPITIVVRPTEPPQRLWVDTTELLEFPPSSEDSEEIGVVGIYPNGIQRDLRSSAAGTHYHSSDPAVVAVNAEGELTATGVGTAVITSENLGVKAFTIVEVTSPGQPLPIAEVTAALNIRRSGYTLNRNTGFFVQEISLTNPAEVPLPGPLYLVVADLAAGVTLRVGGETQELPPLGSPYRPISMSQDGPNLQPGQTVRLLLEFLNPQRRQIQYTPRVYRSSRQP